MVTRKERGRRAKFAPSASSQASSVRLVEQTQETMLEKSFQRGSVALRRTLAIYGHLRETMSEGSAPVPALHRVIYEEKMVRLQFEYCGKDLAKLCPFPESRWKQLRNEAQAKLRDLGLCPRISNTKKNWCLREKGAGVLGIGVG